MISDPSFDRIPVWLHDHIARVGSGVRIEQLSSRRGVTTFTAAGDIGKLLVKLADATEDGAQANRSSVSREAAVLSSVGALRRRFMPDIAQQGVDVALLETWIDGIPAFRDVSAPETADGEHALIELLRLALNELAVLHRAGWAHGDLQPLHFLLAGDGAVLLDYGVAQSAEMPMLDYKGGMVHFNAPEIADDILSAGHATATPASDVFAIASVFAFAITGKVVGKYEMSMPWEGKLAVLAQGRLRTDLLRIALLKSPQLLRILLTLLAVDPTGRPHDASSALRLLPVTA